MAARSIASLTLSFGLVSIPVKLYSATESSSSVKFNMLAKDGSRLKQQYISEKDQSVVPRSEMSASSNSYSVAQRLQRTSIEARGLVQVRLGRRRYASDNQNAGQGRTIRSAET